MSRKRSNRASVRLPNDVTDILEKYQTEHKISRTDAILEAIRLLENPERPVVEFRTVDPKDLRESEEHYREVRALIDGLKQSFSQSYIDASQNQKLIKKMDDLTSKLDAIVSKIDAAIVLTLRARLTALKVPFLNINKLDVAILHWRMSISTEQAKSSPSAPAYTELNEFFSAIGFSEDQIKRRAERRKQRSPD